jgi:hypothetical protein
MTLQPFYSGKDLNPAYDLRYSWTGWPSGLCFQELPGEQILKTSFRW